MGGLKRDQRQKAASREPKTYRDGIVFFSFDVLLLYTLMKSSHQISKVNKTLKS